MTLPEFSQGVRLEVLNPSLNVVDRRKRHGDLVIRENWRFDCFSNRVVQILEITNHRGKN